MAESELPGFRLTGRDREILAAIHTYRALTTPQIQALFFAAEYRQDGEVNARCKHRLRMLYQHGFLYRDEQPQKLCEGRKPLVYFLDRRGAEVLTDTPGTEVDWTPHDNDVAQPFLDHLLATNDVRIACVLAARRHGWTITTWLDDKTLKSPQMKDRVALKGEAGGTQQAAVVPDGYFVLDTGEFLYHHLLEVDRRTVTAQATEWGRRDWARKVRAYLEYYRSSKYEKRFGTKSFRVLTVTTGERRLNHLKSIAEKVGGKQRFWFTTFELALSAGILTEPIWQVAGESAPRGLVW